MCRNIFVILIVILLGVNVFVLIVFSNYRRSCVTRIESLMQGSDELIAFKTNLITSIENSNFQLEDLSLKDSCSQIIHLSKLFEKNQNYMLVCRFSEMNCESCVDNSISTILKWGDSIGKNNILFLGAYRNNKIFSRQKPLYGIDKMNVANVMNLNLPVEELGYPYFFVLDSCLNIFNLYVPNKSTSNINNEYLRLIYERFFQFKIDMRK